MKKILAILIIVTLAISPSFAQKNKKKKKKNNDFTTPAWFYLAVGGGYGNSMLINASVDQAEEVSAKNVNPYYSFGGKIGVNLSFHAGLAFEVTSSVLNQHYDYNDMPGVVYESKDVKVSSLDKTILLRTVGETGSYIELGPSFSKITATSVYSPSFNTTDVAVQDQFKTNMTSIVFGVGGALYYHQKFDINMGIRAAYGFSDMMTTDHYPFAYWANTVNPDFSYSPTHPFTVQLKLEFNWHLGYFQTAKCDGHTEFLMF